MARWLFDGGEQVIDETGAAKINLPFTVWTDPFSGTEVTAQMVAPDGVTVVAVQTDDDGEIPWLRGPEGEVGPLFRDTGTGTRSAWYSSEAIRGNLAAQPVLPAGGQDGDILWWAAERAGEWAAPPQGTGGGGGSATWPVPGTPSTFPPSPHQHVATDVSDSTPVGRGVLTAATQQAARAAIGAGTGDGTSNLQLGTTGTTAAPGNHTHPATAITYTPTAPITANNVQDAITQAALTGGSGGATQLLVWRYTAGSWPALPATKPAGLQVVWGIGPTYPPSVPGWVGLAANQVPLRYSKVAVL